MVMSVNGLPPGLNELRTTIVIWPIFSLSAILETQSDAELQPTASTLRFPASNQRRASRVMIRALIL